MLSAAKVATRLRFFKKPKSMVIGDLFPKLVSKFSDFIAIPLAEIYEITRTSVWPVVWKEEYVTVIPKKKTPTSMDDMRNISCTKLISKVYESYVLEWLSGQVKVKPNQFGGVWGRSVDHLLVHI